MRGARFAVSLDAIHGGAVRVSVDVEFMGRAQHAEFQMNFHDPLSGATNLVEQLLPA